MGLIKFKHNKKENRSKERPSEQFTAVTGLMGHICI